MGAKPSPLLTFGEPKLFVMLEAAVDWRDCTVLVDSWLELLLVVVVRDMPV
jgi:hypothetical protein